MLDHSILLPMSIVLWPSGHMQKKFRGHCLLRCEWEFIISPHQECLIDYWLCPTFLWPGWAGTKMIGLGTECPTAQQMVIETPPPPPLSSSGAKALGCELALVIKRHPSLRWEMTQLELDRAPRSLGDKVRIQHTQKDLTFCSSRQSKQKLCGQFSQIITISVNRK